jgi:hypothetical protein
MYFVFMYENSTMKLVKIIPMRGRIDDRERWR